MSADFLLEIVILAAGGFTLLAVVAALATVLLRIRHGIVAGRWARIEATWEPQLLEVLTGDVSPEGLTGRLTSAEVPYFVGFLGRFVRRLTGPERQRLLTLAQPLLPAIRRGLTARSPEARARTIDNLGLLSLSDDAGDLRAALDDPSPLVAMVAARALTRAGRAADAGLMVAHIHRFQDWRPSYLSAMLAALGPPIAPALRAALAEPAAPSRVRAVAADALARLNDAEAADAAAQVLAHESDSGLRAAALRLLAGVGRATHLPEVRAALASPDEVVRLAAVRAIASLGGADDVPLLARALEDPSHWVAEQAARGLAAGAGRSRLLAFRDGPGPAALIAREVLEEGGG